MRAQTRPRVATLTALFLVLALAISSVAGQSSSSRCGPRQCYNNQCRPSKTQVDFVILLDCSGSMATARDSIVAGLGSWLSAILQEDIDARVGLTTFCKSAAQRVLDMTSVTSGNLATIKNAINGVSMNGGHEDGLAALRAAFNRSKNSSNNLSFGFRDGATRVALFFTDEDSDLAYHENERYATSGTRVCHPDDAGKLIKKLVCTLSYKGTCYSTKEYEYTSTSYFMTKAQADEWDVEIANTAEFLIQEEITTYFFVSPFDGTTDPHNQNSVGVGSRIPYTLPPYPMDVCLTQRQYGSPNLNGFTKGAYDPAKTLDNVLASKAKNSLQARLLEAGRPTRLYDVYASMNGGEFMSDFFRQLTQDTGTCDQCFTYPCSSSDPKKCGAPVNICDCAGTPYGPAKRDCNGVCNGPAKLDCNGVCNGDARFDSCGICRSVKDHGTPHGFCATDCDGNIYIKDTPLPANLNVTWPVWLAPEDYIVANPNVVQSIRGKHNKASHQVSIDDYLANRTKNNRYVCTFDASFYAKENKGAGATIDNAASHYLNRGVFDSSIKARCLDPPRIIPPYVKDLCDACVTDVENPPSCVEDCRGRYVPQSEAYFWDTCNRCVPPNTNPDGNKDECGVCFGRDANKNECGVCDGVKGQNRCGIHLCKVQDPEWCEANPGKCSCVQSCDNTWSFEITKVRDQCGRCVPIGTDDGKCLKDCAGNFYLESDGPRYVENNCGKCLAAHLVDETCVQDCSGAWGGKAFTNPCGDCVQPGDNTCVQDCNREWYRQGESPKNIVSDCGICTKNVEGAQDEGKVCGVCEGGAAFINQCGECYGTTEITPCGQPKCECGDSCSCGKDCADVPIVVGEDPKHAVDRCGQCFPVGEPFSNCLVDCSGAYYKEEDGPTHAHDECGVCSPVGTRSERCTLACDDKYYLGAHPVLVDECGKCRTPEESAVKCLRDCKNTPYEVDSSDEFNGAPNFIDSCNECNPRAHQDTNKDECGVCHGENRAKNQCGVCHGSTEVNECGVPLCFVQDEDWCAENPVECNCEEGCDGEWYHELPVHEDECGHCVSNDIERDEKCVMDCRGDLRGYFSTEYEAPYHEDECGSCLADGESDETCVQDCNGDWRGNRVVDACGVCRSPQETREHCLVDCAGALYNSSETPVHQYDRCFVCNTADKMNSLEDECGVCTNKIGYNSETECLKDCNGDYDLVGEARAIVDRCGDCISISELHRFDERMDACGECRDTINGDDWNLGAVEDSAGNVCGCHVPTDDEAAASDYSPDNYVETYECINADGATFTSCRPCSTNFCATINEKTGKPFERDSCGYCPEDAPTWKGKSLYDRKDSCGMCCDGDGENAIRVCDADANECGNCFLREALDPCGNCMPLDRMGNVLISDECKTDCAGLYGGAATVNRCGHCVVPGSEKDKQCVPDCAGTYYDASLEKPTHFVDACDKCVTEAEACSTSSGGQIAGAVIGGVAAVGLIAVGALLFAKYAKTAGLFASSKETASFSSAQFNPGYEGATNVVDNAIFEQH